ncbi:MAG TPA: pyridoxamine 5'-phosphate oxidase family protein [Sneathiellales bacterium]|jgi:PPOX class probable FMN-dependent enzyme|nr:pyridoxamine 5'-phosphate oxidase family protein [Sneathiellales bacterium]
MTANEHTFDEIITSREQLRAIVGEPFDVVVNKSIDHIDDICRRFIAASPFIMVATKGGNGLFDMSPKGDPAGFVEVLDDHTLAIPDRLGNKRHDTFENLLNNPEVGLFFLIPGNADTLRVSGTAKIVRDKALQARLAVNGKEPEFVLIVTVKEAMTHCPKCVKRSRLWEPDKWPDRSDVPTLAEAMVVHAKLSESVDELQELIDEDGKKRLY